MSHCYPESSCNQTFIGLLLSGNSSWVWSHQNSLEPSLLKFWDTWMKIPHMKVSNSQLLLFSSIPSWLCCRQAWSPVKTCLQSLKPNKHWKKWKISPAKLVDLQRTSPSICGGKVFPMQKFAVHHLSDGFVLDLAESPIPQKILAPP